MMDYTGARAVAMIVQLGSFEAAAQALNVTPSAISQRVRNLEERLGCVLIDRGQPCRATERGAWLCRHMEQVSILEAELHQHLPGLATKHGPACVTLDIATNSDSLGAWFLPALAAYEAETGYLFNIAIDDEQYTAEWLRQGRVLAAVTSLGQAVQGCEVKPLGVLRYVATASPDFMERHFGEGVTLEALAKAPALMFNQKDGHQQRWVQLVFGQRLALPHHSLASTHGFVEACCAGMGWGMNPANMVAEALAKGQLVEMVPGTALDVPLYWQISRLAAGQLHGLTKAVRQAAQTGLTSPA